ncbi:hypothetical protein TUM4438_41440 [Shewanella sairae]|uniref:Uncharacterized protein n=1 Tax=Shewanella sairae TaxID=190310 RepID=A0ABQ4PQZ1_9GAMM|nr:hypothetical protein [Shewanella sairae]MCL1132215.1 hypothetical protein [Shewanella sairae]MCL1132370.1 hypothetical protein [Shewanella sairae]GIU51185.1 hypothetical protein TUM4438_39900 [Shewanella sairae]GIU51524.1 hypothetical protein TUM4438_41440 [Shewanella sairae]
MNSRDFQLTEQDGQFKAKQSSHYWTVEKGSALITGRFEGKEVMEFASKPITTKSALVSWVLDVYY